MKYTLVTCDTSHQYGCDLTNIATTEADALGLVHVMLYNNPVYWLPNMHKLVSVEWGEFYKDIYIHYIDVCGEEELEVWSLLKLTTVGDMINEEHTERTRR